MSQRVNFLRLRAAEVTVQASIVGAECVNNYHNHHKSAHYYRLKLVTLYAYLRGGNVRFYLVEHHATSSE